MLTAEETKWPYRHDNFTERGIVRNKILPNRVWVLVGACLALMFIIFLFPIYNIWLLPGAGFLTAAVELFAGFIPVSIAFIIGAWLSERKRKWLDTLSAYELKGQAGASTIPYSEVVGTKFTPRRALVEVEIYTSRGRLTLRTGKQNLEPLRDYLRSQTREQGRTSAQSGQNLD